MPTIEVSWGELIDKITILEIKQKRLTSPVAVANVQRELAGLNETLHAECFPDSFVAMKQGLVVVNEMLWDIEDNIRAKEAVGDFDAQFVELARAVYVNNDKRSTLKRQINLLLKSNFVEEKQYTSYVLLPEKDVRQ